MIDRRQFLIRAHLETETLEVWIREEWLIPQRDESGEKFTEADVARARLIKDLREDLGVNDEAVPVVLNLIDQIHGLRRTLRGLLDEARSNLER